MTDLLHLRSRPSSVAGLSGRVPIMASAAAAASKGLRGLSDTEDRVMCRSAAATVNTGDEEAG